MILLWHIFSFWWWCSRRGWKEGANQSMDILARYFLLSWARDTLISRLVPDRQEINNINLHAFICLFFATHTHIVKSGKNLRRLLYSSESLSPDWTRLKFIPVWKNVIRRRHAAKANKPSLMIKGKPRALSFFLSFFGCWLLKTIKDDEINSERERTVKMSWKVSGDIKGWVVDKEREPLHWETSSCVNFPFDYCCFPSLNIF